MISETHVNYETNKEKLWVLQQVNCQRLLTVGNKCADASTQAAKKELMKFHVGQQVGNGFL